MHLFKKYLLADELKNILYFYCTYPGKNVRIKFKGYLHKFKTIFP